MQRKTIAVMSGITDNEQIEHGEPTQEDKCIGIPPKQREAFVKLLALFIRYC